jgi:hypothetical protein
MRRGFKKEAAEITAETRAELGLSALDSLNPWDLAAHLAIPVWSLTSYRKVIPGAVDHLVSSESGAFSAMLAFDGLRRVLVHNDGHALTRQRADLTHELAHALLLHQPYPSRDGKAPRFDAEQEEEAKWLGAVLLVTDDFCVASCKDDLEVSVAASRMGVSIGLMRWRVNMSGALRRVARSRARAT